MPNELADLIQRHTTAKGENGPLETAVPGFGLLRADRPRPPYRLITRPALCITVQGAKWTAIGGKRFDYAAGKALIVGLEIPAIGCIMQASPDEPFLGLVIALDPVILRAVLDGLPQPPVSVGEMGQGLRVTPFDGPLADCALRLTRLLDMPAAIPILAPMIMRELSYWLLTGPDGADIARMILATHHTPRIVGAINTLRQRFTEPFTVDELAAIAHLSPSAFHRQFKALTSMSPVQYQKQLRLLEARRLMLAGEANAETAARQVGYESPSQFSREYARMFGAAPRRDTTFARQALAA